ncbi:MAG: hypothetical protein ACXW1R_08820 [Halobacteriota archaeon]
MEVGFEAGAFAAHTRGGYGGISANPELHCSSDPPKDYKTVAAALEKIYKGKDADTSCTKWMLRGVRASRQSVALL